MEAKLSRKNYLQSAKKINSKNNKSWMIGEIYLTITATKPQNNQNQL